MASSGLVSRSGDRKDVLCKPKDVCKYAISSSCTRRKRARSNEEVRELVQGRDSLRITRSELPVDVYTISRFTRS